MTAESSMLATFGQQYYSPQTQISDANVAKASAGVVDGHGASEELKN